MATSLGVWILLDKSFANELLGTNLYAGSAYVLVITGLSVVFVSFLGCLGSIKEVRCMLVIVSFFANKLSSKNKSNIIFQYFTTLFLIFVTMLIGGIIGYVFRAKVEKTIRLGMERSKSDYGNYKPITDAWDETQSKLHCCGVYGYEVWHS